MDAASLQPTGILAVLTNSYLDLRPAVIEAAQRNGLRFAWTRSTGDARISSGANWMLLYYQELPDSAGDLTAICPRLWTGDYSNLLQLLRK